MGHTQYDTDVTACTESIALYTDEVGEQRLLF